jgi:hypothetical protein
MLKSDETKTPCHYCGNTDNNEGHSIGVGAVYSLAGQLQFGKPQLVRVCYREACAKKAKDDGYEFDYKRTYSPSSKGYGR